MRILVDIGNSRCKAAVEDENGMRVLETFAWKDIFLHEVLDEKWLRPLGNNLPNSVVVCNVAGDRLLPNLAAWCVARLGVEPVAMASTPEFNGLRNAYEDPTTLGVDRWAAMIGARADYDGALCVIDSGTATTVDLIAANGQHVGGAILPGIYTMRRSLGKYTSALFAADGDIRPFSDCTASCIAGGTGFASVGAMDRFVMEAKKREGTVTTVVTGGEAAILDSLMFHEVVHDPLLVLKGVSELGRELSLQQVSQDSRHANLRVN